MTDLPFMLSIGNIRTAVRPTGNKQGSLQVDGFPEVTYREQVGGFVIDEALPQYFPATAFLGLLASRFCQQKKCEAITVNLVLSRDSAIAMIRQGIFDTLLNSDDQHVTLQCHYRTFWQNPQPWLTAPASEYTSLQYCFSGEKRHPKRPPIPTGEVYRRYLPKSGTTFSLRTINPDQDLAAFNRWMNLEQVAYFWQQAGTLEEHSTYLQDLLKDPRVHPLIGCFDDDPFAYFEVYWCKEDRIAPYYDVDDYDRGWHVVIGESKHQGIGKLRAWFGSLMHYMFLDDPRTQRIMGEPRIDHSRQIEFLKSQGFGQLKNIQLTHKRAALLRLERETFFDEYHL